MQWAIPIQQTRLEAVLCIPIKPFTEISQLQAATFVSEAAALLLEVSSCNLFTIGQTLFIRGGGFGSDEPVALSINGNYVASASTDASGAFTSSILISCDRPYHNTVQATGTFSGVSVSASFF